MFVSTLPACQGAPRQFVPQTLGLYPPVVLPGEHVRLRLQGFAGQLLTVRVIRTQNLGSVVSCQVFTAPHRENSDVAISTVDELAPGYYSVRVYCHTSRLNHTISLQVIA